MATSTPLVVNGIGNTNMQNQVQAVTADVTILQGFLQAHPSVKFIRFEINEYGNKMRVQLTPIARALALAANPYSGSVCTQHPCLSISTSIPRALYDLMLPDLDAWVPDWSSLRVCGDVAPGHASVMCFVHERVYESSKKTEDWTEEDAQARCPRRALQRVVHRAKQMHDVEFLVGCEVEFMLIESHKASKAVETPSGVFATAALRCKYFKVVEESVEALEAAGVPVWGFVKEGGDGLFEISLSPLPPLQAIDALNFCRETVKTLAYKYGCHATMFPMPFEANSPVGCHVHMSLSKAELGDAFLAGVLKHFRGLTALMLPTYDSYGVREDMFGYGWIHWGWQNKMTPVRRVSDGRFEVRPPDGIANMYLAMAGILGAGMHSVEVKDELTIKPIQKPYVNDPPPEDVRKEHNITERMPRDLEEAIAAMKEDEVLKNVLTEKCFDRYILVKEKELGFAKNMTRQDRREAIMEHM